MTEEHHKGPFPGRHGRYRLGSPLEVLEVVRKQDAARQSVDDLMRRMSAENAEAGVL